jgi:hypothetical protein
MDKYGVMKEIEVKGVRFVVPINATEDVIVKEAALHGVMIEKTAEWKEISDDGHTKSGCVRSE